MIDYLIDLLVVQYPYASIGLGVVAGGLGILRVIAPKTKNTIDDEIIKQADKTGLTKILNRFNPFKK